MPGNDFGDVADADAVLAQALGRHLDTDLVIGKAFDTHLRSDAPLQYFVLQFLRVGFQVGRRHGTGNGQGGNEVSPPQLADNRFLGLVGKIVDGLDLGLDIIEKAIEILALDHLGDCRAPVFAGLAAHLVDVLDLLERLLNALADGLLHLLGVGPRIEDGDFHLVGRDVGKGPALDTRCGEQAHGNKSDHH